jgi:hypothetical protein
MLGGEVAPDGSALAGVTGSGLRYGYDENIACDFCAHQPMRGRVGRIEQRVGHPHIEHIIDTEVRVFEQMCSLGVYLKRVVVIELFWVQSWVTHVASVVASTTSVYEGSEWSMRYGS